MKKQFLYFLLPVLALVAGCTHSESNTSPLLQAGLSGEIPNDKSDPQDRIDSKAQRQIIGALTYTLLPLSANDLARLEAGANASVTEIAVLEKGYTDLQYFRLEIEATDFNGELLKRNLSDAAEYDRRVKYMSFQIQNDLTLRAYSEDYPCAIAHFERSFDITPKVSVLAGFNVSKDETGNSMQITFNDQLFNNGPVHFQVSSTNNNPHSDETK